MQGAICALAASTWHLGTAEAAAITGAVKGRTSWAAFKAAVLLHPQMSRKEGSCVRSCHGRPTTEQEWHKRTVQLSLLLSLCMGCQGRGGVNDPGH